MAENDNSSDGIDDEAATEAGENHLPDDVIERAETLTRRARRAIDENERTAYLRERDALLADRGYNARVRDDDAGETLVLYPSEWIEDGTIQVDRIENTDRGIERSLSGPDPDADWDVVDEHNREVAATVRETHGEIHGRTASAFADFMSNHYAKPIEAATPAEREEFRTEYFPRNAWPSEKQREQVEESIRLLLEVAESS